jgi:predicted adenine nucleotide alpha hydrolase (AANH) superfamily ATPase
MKVLLHICCAPCSIYPIRVLREDRADVMGFFFRDNIHPYTECLKRQETLVEYAKDIGIKLIIPDGYDMEGFLRNVVFREENRCYFCYHLRLEATAKLARRGRFDAFSTTLLYSKFQKHDLIRSVGESVGKSVGIPFFYQDFRDGWKEGVQTSKSLGMYRQPYCGCIYSEKERYYK